MALEQNSVDRISDLLDRVQSQIDAMKPENSVHLAHVLVETGKLFFDENLVEQGVHYYQLAADFLLSRRDEDGADPIIDYVIHSIRKVDNSDLRDKAQTLYCIQMANLRSKYGENHLKYKNTLFRIHLYDDGHLSDSLLGGTDLAGEEDTLQYIEINLKDSPHELIDFYKCLVSIQQEQSTAIIEYTHKKIIEMYEESSMTINGDYISACLNVARIYKFSSHAQAHYYLSKALEAIEKARDILPLHLSYVSKAGDILYSISPKSTVELYKKWIAISLEGGAVDAKLVSNSIVTMGETMISAYGRQSEFADFGEWCFQQAIACICEYFGDASKEHYDLRGRVVETYISHRPIMNHIFKHLEIRKELAIQLFGEYHDSVFETTALIRELHSRLFSNFQISFGSDDDSSDSSEEAYATGLLGAHTIYD